MSGSTANILAVVILVVAFIGFFVFMSILNKKAKK